MSKELWIALIAALVGGAIAFCSTYGHDILKDCKARNNLAKMIYVDTQRLVLDLYATIDKTPESEALAIIVVKNHSSSMCRFDTRVFDTYLHLLPLFSTVDVNHILAFYGNLAKANEVFGILEGGRSGSKEHRLQWGKRLYRHAYRSLAHGREIMTSLESQYKNIARSDGIKKTMAAYEKRIAERILKEQEKSRIPDGE